MKITKKYLQKVIREEIRACILEMEFSEWDDCDSYEGEERAECLADCAKRDDQGPGCEA